MPKAGKKYHIFGDFLPSGRNKNSKTGKEFGIEGKKVFLLVSLVLILIQFTQIFLIHFTLSINLTYESFFDIGKRLIMLS